MAGRKYGRGKYGRGTYDLGGGVGFPDWVPVPPTPDEVWTPIVEPPPAWTCPPTPVGSTEIWKPIDS